MKTKAITLIAGVFLVARLKTICNLISPRAHITATVFLVAAWCLGSDHFLLSYE